MDVKRLSSYMASTNQVTEASKVRAEENASRQGAAKPDGIQVTDRVEFSKEAREMAQANKVAMHRDEIRAERVEQLRQMVQNGTYTVDAEKLAAKMLDEIF